MKQESPVICPEALERIRSFSREKGDLFLIKMTELFLKSAPERIRRIREALLKGDRATYSLEAHTLKSASANLGALQLQRLCQEMEDLAGLEAPRARELCENLEREFPAVEKALLDVLQRERDREQLPQQPPQQQQPWEESERSAA